MKNILRIEKLLNDREDRKKAPQPVYGCGAGKSDLFGVIPAVYRG